MSSGAQIFGLVAAVAVGFAAFKVISARRAKRVLFVITSHSEFGTTGKKTGVWLEELTAPFYAFQEANYEIVLSSPKGGMPPIDPNSEQPTNQTATTKRFTSDSSAMQALQTTRKLSEVEESTFDCIYFPGGHGPLYDLAEDPTVFWLIEKFSRANKPISAVCHAPGVFKKTPMIVKGKRVTGFSNSEEKAVGFEKDVPFLVEDALKNNGAKYEKSSADWHPHVVVDGLLITGQNPASSEGVAKAVIKLLSGK